MREWPKPTGCPPKPARHRESGQAALIVTFVVLLGGTVWVLTFLVNR